MTALVHRIRELLAAATQYSPAPWGVSNSGHQVFVAGPDGQPAPRTGMRPVGDPFPHVANVRYDSVADLIAAAPTLLAQAADELETLDLAYKEAHARAEQCEAEIERLCYCSEQETARAEIQSQRADAAEAEVIRLKTAYDELHDQRHAEARNADAAEANYRHLREELDQYADLAKERIAELETQLHRFQCGQEIESDYLCAAAMDLLASINRVTELEAALREARGELQAEHDRGNSMAEALAAIDAALKGES